MAVPDQILPPKHLTAEHATNAQAKAPISLKVSLQNQPTSIILSR